MKNIICFLLATLLISCDPGYGVCIVNKSKINIYIETENTIESHLALKKGSFYDSIISKKINSSNVKGLYLLKSNEKLSLYGHIGSPMIKDFNYKSVKIIKNNDTIVINKYNILDMLVKKENNYYYIEIK